ncbi:hypothetical protein SUGI_0679100 [Cryptomeria japonica]|nr:hypothetical protein SUGI_0679100 [Cryptomeria japonica]
MRKRKIVSCAACRLQRKKCSQECILAPHFPPDDLEKFTIVQRVYGTRHGIVQRVYGTRHGIVQRVYGTRPGI